MKKFNSFTFNKLNLVGIVKEASRGEVYSVEVRDGESFVMKTVFKGEMVPLDNGGEEEEEELNFQKVFDMITEVAATMRETIYDSPLSFRCKKKTDAVPLMSRQDMF